MMNWETKLRLQAYVDNELNETESREVAALLAREPGAQALCNELKGIKQVLEGNELEVKLPETREFYWSKIERTLRPEPAPERPRSFLSAHPWWVRILAPATGLALLLVTVSSLIHLATPPDALSEIETPLENTSAISFYSPSTGMTVVWVETQ